MDRKKFTEIIICVLLLTVFFALFSEGQAQSKKPSGQAKKLSEQGDRFFGRKDYRSAVNKYAEATVISPNFPYANFWKGYAHYYLKEYDQAVKDLDKALEQGYKPVLELYKTRGYSNYQLKNYDAALRDVRQVLEAEPTNVNFYSLLGNIYYAQGSYQDSIDAFKKVLQFDPNNADVNYFMALSYAGLSDYAQQGLFAAEAVKKNTKFVGESYYLTADAFRRAKKLNEAIEAYERAINVKPEL
ncbi:MAG: tetratricopeptide repeat protein, partial [Acidobacteria bacterium]|nr:tetratricopeptide repeat protein [Acidobacteriota bacterium]